VRNLVVNGFPGYGIEVRRPYLGHDADPCFIDSTLMLAAYVRENYLGTDPRGRVAKPNQRGVGIFTVLSHVTDNLISGNRRSGVYVIDSYITEISRNRIGVAADGSPLGNGAGIFLDMNTPISSSAIADVVDNTIAYNNGMAVARTRAGKVFIAGNSMYDNLQQGIDVDTDGTTPNREDDLDIPNHPVLFSASYDPVQNATIIRGRIDTDFIPSIPSMLTVDLYASARLSVWAYPQAEHPLQRVQIDNGHTDFEITVPGDLRGQWITAATTTSSYFGFATRPRPNGKNLSSESHQSSYFSNTSELSAPVMTQ
jgi:hypothetical protein